MTEKRYRILYEDDWLLVIDKPSGMLVIPTPRKETNTLGELLNKELDEREAEMNAYPCHRLDRETSGLIIYAKGKKVQALMMDAFKKRTVKKTYVALVRGTVKKSFDAIKSSIYNRNRKRNEEALTGYRVVSRRGDFSVLEVEPVTGRTNQIRIHLARIGHPILGERIYAFRRDFNIRFKRVALHAARIEFIHPVTGQKMSFESPLPADMEKLINIS